MPIHTPLDNEILGNPPSYLVRIGSGSILGLIILFIIGSAFIRYPEILVAPFVLSTAQPSYSAIAKINGKIQHLFVQHEQHVKQNEVLAVLENTANFYAIQHLQAELSHFQENNIEKFLSELSPHQYLGEIQAHYEQFLKTVKEYRDFKTRAFFEQKIANAQEQLRFQSALNQNLESQNTLKINDIDLFTKKLKADSVLIKGNAISQREYEETQSNFIAKRQNYLQLQSNVIQGNLKIAELKQQIVDWEIQNLEQHQTYQRNIRQSFQNLISQIKNWEQTYVLHSGTTGKVQLDKFWNINQQVKIGEEIAAVVPDTLVWYCQAMLPVARSGKIAVGQAVILKVDAFPYQEYGILKAKVKTLSLIPRENHYKIGFELENGLNTTYHKLLPSQPEMQGIAEIIAEEMSLLERLFYEIRQLSQYQNQ